MVNDASQEMDVIDDSGNVKLPSPTRTNHVAKESKEGWLFKRSNRIASKRQKWSKEYISLTGTTLRIMKSSTNLTFGPNNYGDVKKSYQLSQYCTVSDVYIREKKIDASFTSTNSVTSITTCESPEEEVLTVNNTAAKRSKSRAKKTIFCIKISWLAGKVRGETVGGILTNDTEELIMNVPEVDNMCSEEMQSPQEQLSSETTGLLKKSGPSHSKKKQLRFDVDDDSSGKHSEYCSDASSNDTETEAHTVPIIGTGDNDDGVLHDDARQKLGGINRHYTQLVKQEQIEKKAKGDKMIHLMYLQNEKDKRQKSLKRVAKGGTYAAAATATAALSILTAGISLAVGLAIVGVTAAVGGTSAAAEMGYRKKKGSTTVVLAAATLREATEWKIKLEEIINNFRFVAKCNQGAESDVGAAKDPPYYVSFSTYEEGEEMSFRRNGDVDLRSKTGYSEPRARWEPIDGGWQSLLGLGAGGLRIYRAEEPNEISQLSKRNYLRGFFVKNKNSSGPLLRSQIIFNASPLNAFMCLMSNGNTTAEEDISTNCPNSGQRASFRILETVDENSDIIHLFFRQTYLFPFWTKARDFVLFRHWRYDSDKTYNVVYHSVSHPNCPPISTHIRGKMDAIYSIAPEKQAMIGQPRCLLTQLIQVDANGWIPYLQLPFLRNQGYNEVFAISTMSVALDVRDALDFDAFVSVSLSSKPCAWEDLKLRYAMSVLPTDIGTSNPSLPDELSNLLPLKTDIATSEAGTATIPLGFTNHTLPNDYSEEDEYNNYDFRYSLIELNSDRPNTADLITKSISNNPAPCNEEKWAEPDAKSFRVRGENYMIDRQKINAGNSLFHLLAVDIYKVNKQMLTGVCSHPDGRMQMALASEKEAKALGINTDLPPFVFVMNLCVKGPPSYNIVSFFGVENMDLIDGTNGTPSSRLCKEFFFGDSDEFRDKTFKMIPQIVEGNFVVRKAARTTPVILGKKLKQYYCRSERFCEITVDMGSSSVANGAIRLCNGFSKSIVVDLAFLLESNDKSMLPEKILGCVRLKNMSLPDDAEPLREIN